MERDARKRILAIERILSSEPINAQEIINRLERQYGIICERKAVYQDLAALTHFINIQASWKGYYIKEQKL